MTTTATTSGDLLSSIATVRQLLQQNQGPNKISDELSALQQLRYEEKLRFDDERMSHQELVQDLNDRLQQAKREAQQEKVIRLSLEETNEALEKYKEELVMQLETASSLRSSHPEDTPQGSVAIEMFQALEQEKDMLAKKLVDSQQEVVQVKTTSDKWKSQCLASQRQVKELQIQLESFRKEYHTSQDRQKELIQGRDTKYESFHRRLEESVAARKKAEEELQAIIHRTAPTTQHHELPKNVAPNPETSVNREQEQEIMELSRKCNEVEKAKVEAEQKIHELEIELEALKRGKSEQEIEQERQIQTEIEEKIAALNESQGQLQKEVDVLTKEVKELEKASKRDNLKEKNEELSLSLMKLGTVLESMESQLKEKLALAKVKSDDHNSELKRVRQDLSVAKMAITAVQSKIIQCQQQQKKLSKTMEEVASKASTTPPESTEAVSTVVSTPTKAVTKKVPAAKAKASPKKRESTDNEGASTKRKKTK